jgi:hypothetical protein
MKAMNNTRRTIAIHRLVLPTIVAGLLAVTVPAQNAKTVSAPAADQQTFATPDEALTALTAAVTSSDKAALRKLIGPAIEEISSGDDVADKASYARFAKRLQKRTNLVKKSDTEVILYVGAENWPMPFPIVRAGDRWFYDGEAGLEEMFNRRIGANELHSIRVCREVVRAQKEYASEDRDGDEVLEFTQHFNSTSGSRNGLYWESQDGDESPLGPLVAYASTGGYSITHEPQPFHGYYFRILTRQGPKAPGGAYSYVINGNMIGGFAVLAYPATWGNSGLMTFIVNQQGKVYQKDLGSNTAAIAAGIRAYNPDSTWSLVEDN